MFLLPVCEGTVTCRRLVSHPEHLPSRPTHSVSLMGPGYTTILTRFISNLQLNKLLNPGCLFHFTSSSSWRSTNCSSELKHVSPFNISLRMPLDSGERWRVESIHSSTAWDYYTVTTGEPHISRQIGVIIRAYLPSAFPSERRRVLWHANCHWLACSWVTGLCFKAWLTSDTRTPFILICLCSKLQTDLQDIVILVISRYGKISMNGLLSRCCGYNENYYVRLRRR